jgi:hypothetical protein
MIDKQRVVRRPSRKRVRNPLKRKDLNTEKAGRERAQAEKAGIGEWKETRLNVGMSER